ncbi:MAG: tetratricopeptide repeat protein [Bacteroidales bacterium]|nr:tetratricopeptide repeat protein [Bacteroidales bacterium]
MRRNPFHIIAFAILLLPWGLPAQKILNTDSLITRLNEQQVEDTNTVLLLNEIAYSLIYSKPDQTLQYAGRALNLSNKIKFNYGKAVSLMNIGHSYRARGFYDPATNYFFSGLAVAETLNDPKLLARFYNHIGVVYYYLEEYQQGLEYYTRALEKFIKLQDESWVAALKNNIGMIYEKMGDDAHALEYYLDAAVINIKLNNLIWLGNNYGNIGNVYRKKNDAKCLDYYNRMQDIFLDINNLEGLITVYFNKGLYYYDNGFFQEALPFFEKSYKFSSEIGSLQSKKNAAEMLGKTYFTLNHFEKAFRFQNHEINLKDSINLNEVSQKIAKAEMNVNLKKEKEAYRMKLRLRNTYIGGGIALLVILLAMSTVLILRQRTAHKKQNLEKKMLRLENLKLSEQLDFKNRELEYYIEFLLVKNNLIVDLTEQLSDLKAHVLPENLSIINGIIFDLKTGVEKDEWEEFEARFQETNESFYRALDHHHPGLTQNERNLCAYLKLGMSSKEISALTKQSLSSIETARSRLRKKIGLAANADLKDYLGAY